MGTFLLPKIKKEKKRFLFCAIKRNCLVWPSFFEVFTPKLPRHSAVLITVLAVQ